MTRSLPRGLAKFDSATVMLRALARFLHGEDFPALGNPRILQYPASLVDWLPRTARKRLFAVLGASEGVSPESVDKVDASEIAEGFVSLYPRRRYPVVMIGSSSGALVHLGAALGAPWLPQTFLTLVRQTDVHPDDAVGAMNAGRDAARRFLAANPDLQLHHMHDPNQDRLMLGYITYFRSKFLRSPPAYRDFLTRSLEPGGTIIITECERRWPTTRIGPRHVYQFGALGGPSVDEYFQGSERVEVYLARCGSPRRRWEPPPPDGESPEAEWGFETALRADIVAFARDHGYRVLRLVFEEPEHLSPVVADFYRAWQDARYVTTNRLVIESFILLEPYWVLRTGSVPFWMKFNMEPSLAWVRRYLLGVKSFDHIHLMLFAHGVDSVGLPPIRAWKSLLRWAMKDGSFLGVDPEAYPAHFSTFARYHMAIQELPMRYPLPDPVPLDRFERFVERLEGRYPVRLIPV